jgi:glycosyltransferase involved in cell wall biosynthesis
MRLADGRMNFVLRKWRFDFTVVPRLASLLNRLNADVVHSYLFDATIAARLASILARRTAVISSERNTDYKFKRKDYLALKATERWNDLTIANSRAGANFNSRVFSQPMSKYCVVHNGVDVTRFDRRDPAKIRKELGIGPKQPVIGMFASFKPQKNHLVWLAAARQVIQRVPNAMLLFVGDELYKGGSDSIEFKKSINQAVDNFGLREHCVFLGNRMDVEECYNACTLTVLPSLFEGTPNVVLESMACGVPVVASNVSDNAYIIRDGETGFVVPVNDEVTLADRVSEILLNPDLRQKLSDQARSWVIQEFSCRRLAEKTAAAYRQVIHN